MSTPPFVASAPKPINRIKTSKRRSGIPPGASPSKMKSPKMSPSFINSTQTDPTSPSYTSFSDLFSHISPPEVDPTSEVIEDGTEVLPPTIDNNPFPHFLTPVVKEPNKAASQSNKSLDSSPIEVNDHSPLLPESPTTKSSTSSLAWISKFLTDCFPYFKK